MTEKEALTRIKTGNFNGGRGFDMQLLVDVVGTIGEMFRNGQISEVVHCKDCSYYDPEWVDEECRLFRDFTTEPDWFCADGERRRNGNDT